MMTMERTTFEIGAMRVACEVLCMRDSYYVWLGQPDSRSMGSLAAAFGSRISGGLPSTTELIGGGDDSAGIAKRLTQRTGKAMFVSCNVASDEARFMDMVQCRVVAYVASLVDSADAATAGGASVDGAAR